MDCFYCPYEKDENGVPTQPRSYLSSEPAMRRATRHNFDIRAQFWDRIQCYVATGNIEKDDESSQKLEVILSGGTWECYPRDERDRFINECYWAANTCGLQEDREILSMEEEQKINEFQPLFDNKIVTTIEEAINFTIAEEYHHDYYARNPYQGLLYGSSWTQDFKNSQKIRTFILG